MTPRPKPRAKRAKWNRDYPARRGWYLVRKSDGELCVRAFGNGMWWTDMGRGNGKDGWLGHGTDPSYEWIGYVGDVFKDKPSVPQAVRNLNPAARELVMREAADVYAENPPEQM